MTESAPDTRVRGNPLPRKKANRRAGQTHTTTREKRKSRRAPAGRGGYGLVPGRTQTASEEGSSVGSTGVVCASSLPNTCTLR